MSRGEKLAVLVTAVLLLAGGIFLLSDRPGGSYTIEIAHLEAAVPPSAEVASPPPEAPGTRLLDINTASLEQLVELPGIGESRGEAILEYREREGPFAGIEDVLRVPGIGEATFAQFRDYIMVPEEGDKQ